jgi:dipeptidyl aminopeptidase/acylaminoacyl peptidase
MSDFQRNEQSDTIYFFDVQNQYIFLGTRRSGFYVYDILNEEWLEPSNVKGQRAIVYTMAYSAQLQKLFVGTFSGIIEYSFVNSSLEYSRIITSADGLPSSAVVSLRYDSSTGGLIVATSSRICIFYPETGKIEHIEESEIDYLTDVYAEIVSLWYMGVYHIYFRSEYGRLFHYYVDYETLNRGIWQIVYSLQQNIVTIFVSVGSSVAILWSKLAIGEDETRQKRKRSLMRRIKRS